MEKIEEELMAKTSVKKKKLTKKAKKGKTGTQKAILLDRVSLNVVKAAAVKDERFCMSGVQVFQDGTTSGAEDRVAVLVEKCSSDPDDFPVMPGEQSSFKIPAKGFHLPPTLVKDVLKVIPSGPTVKILENAKLTQLDKKTVELSTTDLKSTHKESTLLSEKRYPDVAAIFKNHRGGTRVYMDLVVLEKIVHTLRSLVENVEGKQPIELYLPSSEGRPQLIRFHVKDPEGSNERRGLALIMPLQSELSEKLSTWEKKYLGSGWTS